jgi:hypothetical protein
MGKGGRSHYIDMLDNIQMDIQSYLPESCWSTSSNLTYPSFPDFALSNEMCFMVVDFSLTDKIESVMKYPELGYDK